MDNPLETKVFIAAPAASSDPRASTLIQSSDIDPIDLLCLPSIHIAAQTRESPDDDFSQRFRPYRTAVPAAHKEILNQLVYLALENCQELDKRNSSALIDYRIGGSGEYLNGHSVQWLEIRNRETGSGLLPDLSTLRAALHLYPDKDSLQLPPEIFHAGYPRLGFEVNLHNEVTIHPLISQECYQEALDHFLRSIRQPESSVLWALFEDSFLQFLEELPDETTQNSVRTNFREFAEVRIINHFSSDSGQTGCVVALRLNDSHEDLTSSLSQHRRYSCTIRIENGDEHYAPPRFLWALESA